VRANMPCLLFIKKLGRIDAVGHRISSDRTG
jgi:hypothetical protein